MGLIQGIKLYPKAIFFAVIISLCCAMEGYDIALLGNFYAFPPFNRKYGQLQPDGSYQVPAPWQAGISNGAQCGQIVGLLRKCYVSPVPVHLRLLTNGQSLVGGSKNLATRNSSWLFSAIKPASLQSSSALPVSTFCFWAHALQVWLSVSSCQVSHSIPLQERRLTVTSRNLIRQRSLPSRPSRLPHDLGKLVLGYWPTHCHRRHSKYVRSRRPMGISHPLRSAMDVVSNPYHWHDLCA